MSVLQQIYSDPVVYSLGWTLLHACWQIMIIAMGLKICLHLCEKHSATLAYWASVLSIFIVLIWSTHTFISQLDYFEIEIKIEHLIAENIDPEPKINTPVYSTNEQVSTVDSSSNSQEIKDFNLDAYLPLLVVIWLIGACFLVIRFILSWLHIRKLKTIGHSPLEVKWLERFDQLKQRMRINKNVNLLFSSIVFEPITIGHFKPMILIPIGIFANLSPEMVEAILLHELAHIKRSDFLINIFQSFIEIVFFFHPAIWWISNKIRQTREHACDDLALKICNDPLLYANTLTKLQYSILSQKNILAMSAKGKAGDLTTRIKRLFSSSDSINRRRSFLFSSLLFTCLLTLAFTNPLLDNRKNETLPDLKQTSSAILYFITPTTPTSQLEHIEAKFAEQGVELKLSNITFKNFGLLNNIRVDVKMPDKSTAFFEMGNFRYVCLILDWNKEFPLDIRFSASTVTLNDFNEEENMARFPKPYSSNFRYPASIGKIGIKELDNKNELFFLNSLSDSITLFLNGEKIKPEELLRKKLGSSDLLAINQLNAKQAKSKYGNKYPNKVYEIYAKLDKNGNKRTFFERDKDAHLKMHEFKVLHKAELKSESGNSNMLSHPGKKISISADNCDNPDKAFHVFNDQHLEVPEGHCYPPQILALTEVDSFFLLDEKTGTQIYGDAGKHGAYVYYYQEKPYSYSSSGNKYSNTTFDTIIMHDISMTNIKHTNPFPLIFFNDQKLKHDKNTWPDEISDIESFDSIKIVRGASAIKAFGEEFEKGVWYFYKSKLEEEIVVESKPEFPIKEENDFDWILGESLKVFPNPADELVTIEFILSKKSKIKVYIFDNNGKEVAILRDGILEKGPFKFNFNPGDLPNGVYTILVQTVDEAYSKQLILQRAN